MEALWGLVPLGIIFIAFFVSKFYNYIQQENIKNKVAACIQGYIGGHSSPIDVINEAQHQLNIAFKYQIGTADMEYAKLIIELYRKELNKKFLNNTLRLDRYITKMTDTEYFFLTFHSFLRKHDCDTSLSGKDLLNLKQKESLGMWGAQRYRAEYTLTEFGVVFYKLYYVTLLYCETNPSINNENKFRGSDNVKRTLNTQEIIIERL